MGANFITYLVLRLTEPNHAVVDVLFRCSFHHTIRLPYCGRHFVWLLECATTIDMCASLPRLFSFGLCVFGLCIQRISCFYLHQLFPSSPLNLYNLCTIYWVFDTLIFSAMDVAAFDFFSFLSAMKMKANERNLSRPITQNNFIAIDYSTCSQCTFHKQHTTKQCSRLQ